MKVTYGLSAYGEIGALLQMVGWVFDTLSFRK